MGDVILFIDEKKNSKLRISRCRICHEEEEESFFEAPCSCSGTVKFAHRDCIQRWCNEKGNTTCEICLQVYKNGYTTIPKKSKVIEEEEVIIRINRRRRRRLVSIAESDDLIQCNTVADRGAFFCRSLTFIFSVFLLMKHTFDAIYGTEEYPFTVLTVITFKAIGILLPMFIIIRTITAIQKTLRRHQYSTESEEDLLSSDEEEDDDELEEEDEDEEQQQHLA